jgi:hypothetical protein
VACANAQSWRKSQGQGKQRRQDTSFKVIDFARATSRLAALLDVIDRDFPGGYPASYVTSELSERPWRFAFAL